MPRRTHSRRDFLRTSFGAALAATLPVPSRAAGKRPEKPEVVVVGFDGVDPRLVDRWIASGDLPHLAALKKTGTLTTLGSTSPPNSPVAWSTFASGLAPDQHGVFGFLKRNPANYLPGISPYTITPPRFGPGGAVAPSAESLRAGEAFWEGLDRIGVPTTMLFVPYAYPPPALKHGRVLSGLGTPDLRFTNSSFTLFTSEPSGSTKKDNVAGGRIVRLQPDGSSIETRLEGPRGPDGTIMACPLQFHLQRAKGSISIRLGGRHERLKEGERSGWFPVTFEAQGLTLAGRVRFHLISVRGEFKVYASAIQFDPRRPALPIGSPARWVKEAVASHGGLPTVGWVHDTSAVNAGALPKKAFLSDILDTMEGRTELLLRELASGHSLLNIAVFTGTDRAAHIFYRDIAQKGGGPLRQVYRAMDRIIGKVQRSMRPGSRLLILSDHGFHPFDRMLHVNTWLESQDWFARTSPNGVIRFLRGVRWDKTMAYAMGNGQVYVNLLGREGKGSVTPGKPKQMIIDSIRGRLKDLKDPLTGIKPVRAVYDVYPKASPGVRNRAPDLQIAFAPGYRSSWETSLGGAPTGEFFAANTKEWCGDHAASDVVETPGFFATNEKLKHPDPNILDLANTLLDIYGAPLHGAGRSLLE